MSGFMHRLTQRNYGSAEVFLTEAQRHAVLIAEAGSGASKALLAVWLDDNRQGVSMRLMREPEMNLEQSWAWRPHRAFPLDKVADDGVKWLAQMVETEKGP